MKVYRNSEYYTDIDNPYDLQSWAEASGVPFSELTLDLAEVKTFKIDEVERHANEWYQTTYKGFQGAVIGLKDKRGQLDPAETAIRDDMDAKYVTLRNLRNQITAATSWQQALNISWPVPQGI